MIYQQFHIYWFLQKIFLQTSSFMNCNIIRILIPLNKFRSNSCTVIFFAYAYRQTSSQVADLVPVCLHKRIASRLYFSDLNLPVKIVIIYSVIKYFIRDRIKKQLAYLDMVFLYRLKSAFAQKSVACCILFQTACIQHTTR